MSTREPDRPAPPPGLRCRDDVMERDIDAVRELVRDTGFFHASEVEMAAELVDERVRRGDASDYWFSVLESGEALAGYACWGPIPCTADSFDLYWIAVDRVQHGRGLGRWLLHEAERRIAAAGGRHVWVETSSRGLYEPTRRFYLACGYREAAILDDFYAPGDGKVIYTRRLDPRG